MLTLLVAGKLIHDRLDSHLITFFTAPLRSKISSISIMVHSQLSILPTIPGILYRMPYRLANMIAARAQLSSDSGML